MRGFLAKQCKPLYNKLSLNRKGELPMETMGSLRRTNYCGEVSMSNVGQEMTV